MDIKQIAKKICSNPWFEHGIMLIIVLNSILIGVETYIDLPVITAIQSVILGIFTIEIIIRFIARDSLKQFFTNPWNIFDLTLVLIGYIPESFMPNTTAMMTIRVLRIFRVLRLLRLANELKLIISVLLRSMSSMFYNVILFVIFIYLFAIIGVGLFRLPTPEKMTEEEKVKYEQFLVEAPNAPTNSPDPYGTLDEAMFTLFRALTGEDWTDLRYNLVTATKYNLIHVSPTIVTTYHVLWFILAAFLLLNLVTGAIINNYMLAKEEQDNAKTKELKKE